MLIPPFGHHGPVIQVYRACGEIPHVPLVAARARLYHVTCQGRCPHERFVSVCQAALLSGDGFDRKGPWSRYGFTASFADQGVLVDLAMARQCPAHCTRNATSSRTRCPGWTRRRAVCPQRAAGSRAGCPCPRANAVRRGQRVGLGHGGCRNGESGRGHIDGRRRWSGGDEIRSWQPEGKGRLGHRSIWRKGPSPSRQIGSQAEHRMPVRHRGELQVLIL